MLHSDTKGASLADASKLNNLIIGCHSPKTQEIKSIESKICVKRYSLFLRYYYKNARYYLP